MTDPTKSPQRVHDDLKQTVGRALGKVPSGVFILAAEHGPDRAAMMVSWVQQAAFDPPTVTVAIGRDRPTAAVVQAAQAFTLSVLGLNNSALMKKYARGTTPGQDPFEGVSIKRTASGLPALADAVAYLECHVEQVVDFGGDHQLFLARVTAGDILLDGPSFTHVRANGFHY